MEEQDEAIEFYQAEAAVKATWGVQVRVATVESPPCWRDACDSIVVCACPAFRQPHEDTRYFHHTVLVDLNKLRETLSASQGRIVFAPQLDRSAMSEGSEQDAAFAQLLELSEGRGDALQQLAQLLTTRRTAKHWPALLRAMAKDPDAATRLPSLRRPPALASTACSEEVCGLIFVRMCIKPRCSSTCVASLAYIGHCPPV